MRRRRTIGHFGLGLCTQETERRSDRFKQRVRGAGADRWTGRGGSVHGVGGELLVFKQRFMLGAIAARLIGSGGGSPRAFVTVDPTLPGSSNAGGGAAPRVLTRRVLARLVVSLADTPLSIARLAIVPFSSTIRVSYGRRWQDLPACCVVPGEIWHGCQGRLSVTEIGCTTPASMVISRVSGAYP
jgi:hypothetical protein